MTLFVFAVYILHFNYIRSSNWSVLQFITFSSVWNCVLSAETATRRDVYREKSLDQLTGRSLRASRRPTDRPFAAAILTNELPPICQHFPADIRFDAESESICREFAKKMPFVRISHCIFIR